MLLASYILYTYEVHALVEATFQNFAAGLIVAAVAAELFPLMLHDVSPANSMIGMTCGFVVGLGLIYGLEALVEYFEGGGDEDGKEAEIVPETLFVSSERTLEMAEYSAAPTKGPKLVAQGLTFEQYQEIKSGRIAVPEAHVPAAFTAVAIKTSAIKTGSPPGSPGRSSVKPLTAVDWPDELVLESSKAIENPTHQQKIGASLRALRVAVAGIEHKTAQLTDSGAMTRPQVEAVAEKIDEDVHKAAYLLDHCRRTLQGMGSEEGEHSYTKPSTAAREWLSQEKRAEIKLQLHELVSTADHLLDHIDHTKLDAAVIKVLNNTSITRSFPSLKSEPFPACAGNVCALA